MANIFIIQNAELLSYLQFNIIKQKQKSCIQENKQ